MNQPAERPLHTQKHKRHVAGGIQTHPPPGVQVGDDSSCLRPCGHYDRQVTIYFSKFRRFGGNKIVQIAVSRTGIRLQDCTCHTEEHH
jgi:hypothetical protein